MGLIVPLDGVSPTLGRGVFIAPNATLIGAVEIGIESSVWFGAVLRGDVGTIAIGSRTNVQDLTMIHMTGGMTNTRIGDDVTVGHSVILHGCTIGHRCLIGMGSIVLDGAEIGDDSLIAAGSLVTPRTVIPAGSFVVGRPAKVLRPATPEERCYGPEGARHYVENARRYAASLG
jgi:carbonic anhydrase/acetyltransferase-like protein (isoleucine patch superfamily)